MDEHANELIEPPVCVREESQHRHLLALPGTGRVAEKHIVRDFQATHHFRVEVFRIFENVRWIARYRSPLDRPLLVPLRIA